MSEYKHDIHLCLALAEHDMWRSDVLGKKYFFDPSVEKGDPIGEKGSPNMEVVPYYKPEVAGVLLQLCHELADELWGEGSLVTVLPAGSYWFNGMSMARAQGVTSNQKVFSKADTWQMAVAEVWLHLANLVEAT